MPHFRQIQDGVHYKKRNQKPEGKVPLTQM